MAPPLQDEAIPDQLRLSGGLVDLARCQVVREQKVLALTHREVALLRYFMANPGRAIARDELLGEVWGYVEGVRSRATDNAIVRLRNKVEASADEPSNILSVRGVGYRFEMPVFSTPPAADLPVQEPTSFVGRDADLAQLSELFDRGHLVTVLGGPGMGKTRLARRFAHSWRGPSWFVDLSASTSLSQLTHAVAAALSLPLDPAGGAEQAMEAIGRSLAGQKGPMLVLDNFEQVADLAPQTLAIWVRVAPEARILTTSRQRLLVAGEQCLELAPLEVSAAIELFVDRARLVAPDFDKTAQLDELVRRLDGVPLALELAASRVHLLPLRSMLQRLDRLGGGRSDASPRHRTLQAAFQWSWDLLTEPEREGMRQCALFESSFSFDAAEAVLSSEEPVDEILAGLRNKSMLERASDVREPRFRLLSTVRQFVVQTEGGAALQKAQLRHLDWCLERAEAQIAGLKGAKALESAQALGAELDDQLAAIRRGADPVKAARLLVLLDDSPALIALPVLHRELVDHLLAEELPDPLRCRLLQVQAGLRAIAREVEQAHDSLTRSEKLTGDDPDLLARATSMRAKIHEVEGDSDLATRTYAQAAEIHRAAGNRAGLATALTEVARIKFNPSRLQESEELFIEALDMASAVGDRRLEGRVLGYLGVVAQGRRRFAEADGYFRKALERARAMGDPAAAVVQTIHLGGLVPYLDASEAELESVEGDVREAIDVASQLGRLHLQAAATGVLLQLLLDQEHVKEAREAIDSLPPDWAQIPPMLRAMTWTNIAAIHHLGGEATLADRAYGHATASFEGAGQPKYVWRTLCFHALFLAEHGRHDEAEQKFDAAEAGVEPRSLAPWLADVRQTSTLLYRAEQAAQNGGDPAAATLRAEAAETFERVVDAPALKALDSPIRSSHRWVVKCLRRALG